MPIKILQGVGVLLILTVAVCYVVGSSASWSRSDSSQFGDRPDLTGVSTLETSISDDDWTQWGGDSRNFKVATSFSELGKPKMIWRKGIGQGHSAVITRGKYAFVCYKKRDREWVEKLAIADGKSAWTTSFELDYSYANEKYDGPNSTPLIAGNRIFCISKGGTVRCLDISDGSVLWNYSLKNLGTKIPQSGYGSSPLIWKNTLVVPALGNASPEETEYFRDRNRKGQVPGAVGIDCETGKIRWQTDSFRLSHSSPILVELDGIELAVFHGMFELVAVDPATGKVIWRFLLRSLAADNVAFTPIWDSDRQQFLISHGYCDQGTQAISVSRSKDRQSNNGWSLKREWKCPTLRVNHTNAVLLNDRLIASNRSPNTLLITLDAKDGNILSRQRSFEKATIVGLKQQLLMLESDGQLSLQNPEAISTRLRHRVLGSQAWTVPTIIGNRILVRDAMDIKMFEWVGR